MVAYNLLKKYLHTGPLRLSLFLILLFLATSLKEINYDDDSGPVLCLCRLVFVLGGLTREKLF